MIVIKAKNVVKSSAKKAQAVKVEAKKTAKAPVAKSSAKTEAKKAGREPIAKKFFLSREAAAIYAMRGIDLIPCFWAGNSCHAASEFGASVVSQADKIAKVKLTTVKGWYMVACSEKGARCVPITHASGSVYERKRDGITVVRGDTSLVSAHVGSIESCEKWLKAHVKKGLTDFWRSKDGSKETARAAGFTCF